MLVTCFKEKEKNTERRGVFSEAEGESVPKMNLFISLFIQVAGGRHSHFTGALPGSSPAMQLGGNNVCGPDATAEVTRRDSGGWARPPPGSPEMREEKADAGQQGTARAAPATQPRTHRRIFLREPRQNGPGAQLPNASQGRARWRPCCRQLSSHSAEAVTQDETCLNITKREQRKERERTKAGGWGGGGKQDQQLKAKPISRCDPQCSRSVLPSAAHIVKCSRAACPQTLLDCRYRGQRRQPTKRQTAATPNCPNAPTPV